jgi:short-subunit dehydrogenase
MPLSSPSPGSLAVITGPTAGIGRVFAQRLAARGHALLLVARDAGRLEALATELSAAYGVPCRTMVSDLATDAGMEALAQVLAAEPEVGVLVNNAGFGTKGKLHETALDPQMDMLRLHVLAPMRLTHAVLPGMVARGRGWVINNSSVASFLYGPGNANYCATKAYLTRLTLSLDTELHRTGVVVQALCPGFTHSEFHARMRVDKGRIPSWLWLSPESVVDASLAACERGGPAVLIPTWRYRLITAVAQWVPHGVRRRMKGLSR